MPIQFTVYPASRLVSYAVEGVVTPDDARGFISAFLTHRRFRKGFDFIGECRESGGEVDAAFTPALAHEVRMWIDRLGPCRWAVVVSSPAGLTMVRMLAALTRPGGVEVVPFLSRAEAMGWLGSTVAYDHEQPALTPAP
jgi:hypothetical protein